MKMVRAAATTRATLGVVRTATTFRFRGTTNSNKFPSVSSKECLGFQKLHQQHQHQERRWISLLQHNWLTAKTSSRNKNKPGGGGGGDEDNKEDSLLYYPDDLDHALCTVRQYDPSGYLPGQLLPNRTMQLAYYAVRNFWIETGHYSNANGIIPFISPNSTPEQCLDWWQEGIQEFVFSSSAESPPPAAAAQSKMCFDHPSLRLLRHLVQRERVPWTPESLIAIVNGRREYIRVKQYETMEEFITYAKGSCGALFHLVLEAAPASLDDKNHTTTSTPTAFMTKETHFRSFQAAQFVGVCHGLTNALRQSIPMVSIMGKLVVPQDLTHKYHIATPRYLLSALAQGDLQGEQAMKHAVQDICQVARNHLEQARSLRSEILCNEQGSQASTMPVLLAGLASETFLDRLKAKQYQLTDRNLRLVGFWEHGWCSARMIRAYLTKTF